MQIDTDIVNPSGNLQQVPKAKKTQHYVSVDYASLRNMVENSPPQPFLLPGLGKRGQKISMKRVEPSQTVIEEPQLLTTAKDYLKDVYKESTYSEVEQSNRLGLSSFLNSRQPTPYNPLQHSSKRKVIQSQKNKVNSMATELFDIQSNPQAEETVAVKIKKPEFKLFDCILGQGDAVYSYVFGRSRNISPKLIQLWKDCLSHEDKSQIYLPVGDDRVEIPYSHARIYPLNQIEKEFKQIYGVGKNRSLTAGEQAVLLQSIRKYLSVCSREPLKIGRKDYDIMEDILKDCKLSDLENYPLCLKQAEIHFKLMATKWRYSGDLNEKDRMVESALVMGRNNFLDLSKSNILTEYLLSKSNIEKL